MFCKGALDSNKAKEKILFFYLGDPDNELTENQKAKETYRVSAIRLVLGKHMNLEVQVVNNQDVFPTAQVNYRDAIHILNYINYNR
jgi:hypothetical protein